MQSKKLIVFLLVFLFSFAVYASSYNIKIENAGDVSVSGNVYTLTDNVMLTFKTTDKETEKTRSLSAYQIVIDADENIIQAFGNVSLKEGDDSFAGDALELNWDNLDVIVFGGSSSSVRDNSSGDNVEFFASGESISYAGNQDTVLFRNGVIATTKDNPYWSISAKKIGLLESDLYFEKATVKLGRVPVMYLPAFFYPGTKLAFNPAIGTNSVKGRFINTTYELYGKYPGIGKVASSGDTGEAASLFSFLESGEKKKTVREGWIYTANPTEKTTETSAIQQWAEKTSSYMAVFADIYEVFGPAIGFDTKNKFSDNFSMTAKGMIALNNDSQYPKLRFALDDSFSFVKNKSSFSIKTPYYSDPYARSDYFNRNTVFGLDSVLGSLQYFPNDYSSSDSSFSWTLSGKTQIKIGKLKIDVGSIKGQVDWKYDRTSSKYEITAATLPYISLSSSGTIFSWTGKSRTEKEEVPYSSELAESYYQEKKNYDFVKTTQTDTSVTEIKNLSLKPISGQSLKREVSKSVSGGSLSSSYSYKQTISRTFKGDMSPDTFTTAISGSLRLSGKLPANIFSFNSSLTPTFKYTDKIETINKDFTLKGSINASVPNAGVSYSIGGKIYSVSEEENTVLEEVKQTEETFKWSEDFITTHYIQLSKSFGSFSATLKETIAPVKESLTPSISYKKNIFSASAGTTVYWGDEMFKKGKATLNAGFSFDKFSVSLNNTYNFEKEGWSGYSATQTANLSLFGKKLSLGEKLILEDKFKPKSMNITASFKNTNANLSLNGEKLELNTLSVSTKYVHNPIYFWKNRIGFSSSLNGNLVYNFKNPYGTTLSVNFTMSFAVLDFLSFDITVKSANTSFFRYYEGNNFIWSEMFKDLARSFDFFNMENRTNTGFNMTNYSFKLVHYLEDFNLYVNGTSKFVRQSGKTVWKPEVSVYIKWKAIPELKVNNTWNKISGWEKK